MNILVASDSFKGTLSSEAVGQIVKEVLIHDQVDVVSISDGGEGVIEALKNKINGKRIKIEIKDPLGRMIEGYYLLTDQGEAVIESAVACGLSLLGDDERNPLLTSSYGLGMMIDDALKRGAKHFVIGIGGTSTNDGGLGMLEALGVKFYDDKDSLMTDLSGKDLKWVARFEADDFIRRLQDVRVEVACDVDNPLLGDHGATYTFSPQKGATPDMCHLLEEGMVRYADVVSHVFGSKHELAGSGAAGGLGFCFVTFFSGILKSGIDLVLDALSFDDLIKKYDLVITGEGKIDSQTSRGKVLSGILNRTSRQKIRTIAICGIMETDVTDFEKVFSVVPTVSGIDESLRDPETSLRKLIEEHVKSWLTK
ncbi:glycerate kinase [Acidaminobacter sp. JC074]|uniref:glycerate kinase family protein n=1 Tax=Acidaminobacter sp. JC074 TaxID=2530199 RepID=UPI001F0DDDC6|nr:glycerate kinase [Acidaminobacter sp. JC074]